MLEILSHGRNHAQDNYRKAVEICEAAGSPVRPLSPTEISRLDTGKVELLSDAQRRLSRQTTWGWSSPPGPDSLCLFEFEEHVSELYADAQHTGWSGDESDPGWHESEIEPEDFQAMPVDEAEQVRMAESLGWQPSGMETVGGQPCKRWRNERESSCMWSAGTQAGYSSAPPGYADCFVTSFARFEAAIPLRAEPLDGNGCRIRLQSMSVGKGTLPAADASPRTKFPARGA